MILLNYKIILKIISKEVFDLLSRFKKYCNEKMLKSVSFVITRADHISTKKGDTQLIVLVLLLAVVAVAVTLFKNTFMTLLGDAMNRLTQTFNNLFG
jgi:hypothetical protein